MRALRIRFYIDPSTGAPHIPNHQVGEDEVADGLEGPGEDRAGGEGSRTALGQTASGRSRWGPTACAERKKSNEARRLPTRMGRGKGGARASPLRRADRGRGGGR